MDEMLEETMEGMDDGEELESEANEEVEKILFEITDGKLGVQNSKVGALPVSRFLSSISRTSETDAAYRTFRSLQNRRRKICRRTRKWRELLLGYSIRNLARRGVGRRKGKMLNDV